MTALFSLMRDLVLGLAAMQAAANPVAEVVASLQQRHFAQAAQQADVALRAAPNDPRLWTLKGMALSAGEPTNPKPAQTAFDHALALAPDYLPALEAAAQLEYASGDARARGNLEHVLRLRPTDPTANAMLAELDFQSSEFAAAATHFQQAEPVIATQALPLSHYGASLAQSGRPAEAVPVFEQVASLQPNDVSALYNVALAQLQNHQPSAALARLQPLLDSPSATEASLTLGADLQEALAHTQQSVDLLRTAILRYPKQPEAYLNLANLSFAHSSMQVGIDILNAGIVQLPQNAELYLARGVLLGQIGRNDEAVKDFEKANTLNPRLTLGRTAIGITQSQQHQSAEALATFRTAAKQQPNNALTQYLLAEALAETSPATDSTEGKEELAAALRAAQLDPKMVAAYDLIATIYLRANLVDKVEQYSNAALALNAKDEQALYHLILAARKGSHKDQLPSLILRLNAAKSAADDPIERPKGYLVESK